MSGFLIKQGERIDALYGNGSTRLFMGIVMTLIIIFLSLDIFFKQEWGANAAFIMCIGFLLPIVAYAVLYGGFGAAASAKKAQVNASGAWKTYGKLRRMGIDEAIAFNLQLASDRALAKSLPPSAEKTALEAAVQSKTELIDAQKNLPESEGMDDGAGEFAKRGKNGYYY